MSDVHADPWDAERYDRFRNERERPALDLLAMVLAHPGGRAVDLGCGTGRYTALLHERVGAAETLGIDSSARMLGDAAPLAGDGLRFVDGDLASLDGDWDVVFANASLQWVPGHRELIPSLAARVRPGGQLLFQVPTNYGHASHVVADEVGRSFGLEPLDRTAAVLDPASYAEILHRAGLRDIDVTLRIYGHEMPRSDEVIEWVSGTLFTAFERRLSPEDFVAFRAAYRDALLTRLGDPTGEGPYFYAFGRILAAGRRPS